jgi:hypothetical protein
VSRGNHWITLKLVGTPADQILTLKEGTRTPATWERAR